MELDGRTALVTGAGHRVGRAIAVALGARKMRVAVHYNATADGAKETLRAIEKARRLRRNVRRRSHTPRATDRTRRAVVKRFGGLDVLVNSAAVMLRTPLGEIDASQWDGIMALNLRAPFLLSQAAAPHLRRARGAIVNIADLAAFETWPDYLVARLVEVRRRVPDARAGARARAGDPRRRGGAGNGSAAGGWSDADAERLRGTTPLRAQRQSGGRVERRSLHPRR